MFKKCLLISALLIANQSFANHIDVKMTSVDNKDLGTISFEDSHFGLLITPNLSQLPEGQHGFHIHEHADCGDHGMNAMGHLDPKHSGKHLGPYAKGHLGDLPVLVVDKDGHAKTQMLAPRLKVSDLKNHSVMIHAGSDNYSDQPKLGGGGERIACGIVK